MAITSASLLQYPNGVGVTDNGTNETLVNRKYVTGEIFNAVDWSTNGTGGTTGAGHSYVVGNLVHYNGQLYTCKKNHTSTASFSTDLTENWERTYPILHKYVGQRDNLVDQSTVTITHNLGTTDLTVQVYESSSGGWVPIMVNFVCSGENAIVLNFGTNYSGTVRVVIVAAK